MFGSQKNNRVLRIKYPIYFVFIWAVLAISAFFLLSDSFRAYRSQIWIMIVFKDEKTARQSETIMENLVFLPQNLSFYEKIIRDNPEMTDSFARYGQDQKKSLWNQTLKIWRERKSSVIALEIKNKNSQTASALAKKTTLAFLDTVAYYYNVKSEIDQRIIEGPITSPSFPNQWWVAILSLVLGLAVTGPFYFLFQVMGEYLDEKKQFWEKRANLGFLARPDSTPFPNKEALPVSFGLGKTPAPSNLPTAQNNFHKVPDNLPVLQAADFSKVPKESWESGEPSEEEYKKRLNQLLKGEL